MENRLEIIIKNWVLDNFGESEAEDPSWNIEALAKELAGKFHDLYWAQELEYIKEDVKAYAKSHDYNLTDKQMYSVADEIRNSDWYCSINVEDMDWYIKRELEIAKEKGELNANHN